jgi:hypothetical protein
VRLVLDLDEARLDAEQRRRIAGRLRAGGAGVRRIAGRTACRDEPAYRRRTPRSSLCGTPTEQSLPNVTVIDSFAEQVAPHARR